MNGMNPAVIAMRQAASGEAFAFGIYTIFAAKLREKGYASAAMLLEEMAGNEKEHMELWLEKIGEIPSVEDMLDTAATFENADAEEMYTNLARLSDKLPPEAIELANNLKDVERHHREMAQALSKFYKTGSEEKVTKAYMWICPHCGRMYENKEDIPDECPVCKHSKDDYVYRETVIDSGVGSK